jgi:hypothetical protein
MTARASTTSRCGWKGRPALDARTADRREIALFLHRMTAREPAGIVAGARRGHFQQFARGTVVGASAIVHVTGEINARPRRFEVPEHGELGLARIELFRIDPESGRTLEEIVRIDTNISLDHSTVDVTVVLEPGRYVFRGYNNANGDTCTDCDVDADASVSFGLIVQ